MKSMIDLIILSVGFWVAAAKLFLYFHPVEAPQVAHEQSFDQIEERPDPEVQAVIDNSNQEIIKAKVDKEQTEDKAQQAAIKASEVQKAKIDADHKAEELAAAKKDAEKKLQAAQDESQKNLEAKTAAEALVQKLQKEKDELDAYVKGLEEEVKKKADSWRMEEMESALKKQEDRSDKEFETELVRHWSSNLQKAKEQAVKTNTPVFVVFEGSSCPICKWLNANVYASPQVSPILRGKYIPVWLLCSNEDLNHIDEYQKPHPNYSFPYCVVIQPDGSWKSFTPYFDKNKSKEVHIEHFLNDLKANS